MSSLQGDLTFFPLEILLRFLAKESAAGSLRLESGEAEAIVTFRKGSAIKARSSRAPIDQILKDEVEGETAERLGELVAGTGGVLTSTAAQRGIFSHGDLVRWASTQTVAVLEDALLWDSGTFSFTREADDLGAGVEGEALDLDALLKRGAERRRLMRARRAAFPDPALALRVVESADQEKITLTPAELKMLLRVDGRRTVKELVGEGPAADEGYAVLQALRTAGLIQAVPAPGASPASPEAEGKAERTGATEKGSDTTLSGAPSGGFSAACLTMHDDAKTSFPLFDPTVTIGRDPSSDVPISDASVSTRHARLTRTMAGYEIEDLQSRNGTFVNGERTTRQVLRDGDTVRLGKILMVYSVAASLPAPSVTQPGPRGS